MTWQIALVFALLIGAMIGFAREKIPPDLVALTLFVVIALTGLVSVKDTFAVFSNPAPITVAAMFVLSAALVRCGALDYLRGFERPRCSVFGRVVSPGGADRICFAWINNTPVVVVFVPVCESGAKDAVAGRSSSSRSPTPPCSAASAR